MSASWQGYLWSQWWALMPCMYLVLLLTVPPDFLSHSLLNGAATSEDPSVVQMERFQALGYRLWPLQMAYATGLQAWIVSPFAATVYRSSHFWVVSSVVSYVLGTPLWVPQMARIAETLS